MAFHSRISNQTKTSMDNLIESIKIKIKSCERINTYVYQLTFDSKHNRDSLLKYINKNCTDYFKDFKLWEYKGNDDKYYLEFRWINPVNMNSIVEIIKSNIDVASNQGKCEILYYFDVDHDRDIIIKLYK